VFRRSFWIRAFQVLTLLFFLAMMTCVSVAMVTGDRQPPVIGITFFQWIWIAMGFLPLFFGSFMTALKLSGENDAKAASPQEEPS
jgi:hypothetical protein